MATVTFTTRASLVAGNPENIADVTNCLDKLLAGVNSVAAAQIEAQQAWQTIALPASLSSGSLAYYKDSLGIVRFRGDAFTAASTVATGAVLCTLPVGYRPGTTHHGVVTRGTDALPADVTITTAGVMTLVGPTLIATGNTYFFSLLGNFRAEN